MLCPQETPGLTLEPLVRRSGTARPATDGSDTAHAYTGLRRGLLGAQRDELTRLHADGEIGDTTRRRIQRRLDLEEAGLVDG